MANEITISLGFSVDNSGLKKTVRENPLLVDQSSPGGYDNVLSIGTSAETITLTDITTEGYALFKNLDDTNFVTWGPDSTGIVPFGRLKPGEIAGPLRIEPGTTISMQADTAPCQVRVLVLED